jgi:hypothetical protein
LLTISTAAQNLLLPDGSSPLDDMKALIWDDSLAQDRFFAWADARLVEKIKTAPHFDEEKNPGIFHKGATCSYKQTQFDVANLQLTFHENRTRTIGGVACVVVEPDIDYYRDIPAHALFEVVPSAITGELTDPTEAYALRWMAAREADQPEFDPPFSFGAA